MYKLINREEEENDDKVKIEETYEDKHVFTLSELKEEVARLEEEITMLEMRKTNIEAKIANIMSTLNLNSSMEKK